jgi:hypothetical protein
METLKNKTNTRLKLKKVELSSTAKSIGGGCFREGPHYVCCYQGDTWHCMGHPPLEV